VGRDNVVGIATRYGLDGRRIESQWGVRFSAPVPTGIGAHLTSYRIGTGSLSRGVKRPVRGVDHQHRSSAEVKERVDLYLYSSSGLLWLLLGRTLPLLLLSTLNVRFMWTTDRA